MVKIGFPPTSAASSLPPPKLAIGREEFLDELSVAVVRGDSNALQGLLDVAWPGPGNVRDAELAVACLHELGRARMKERRFRDAAVALSRAMTLHNRHFYANASLINDFAVSFMLLDDPAGWRFAYCALVLASRVGNTDVIAKNLAVAAALVRRAESSTMS